MSKYVILVAVFLTISYVSFELFNEVSAWMGIFLQLIIIGVSLNYLIKFIKKDLNEKID